MLRYDERDAVKPASPLDLAPELGCPWLGLYGEEDALSRSTTSLRSVRSSSASTSASRS
jgi:hypothetical protein